MITIPTVSAVTRMGNRNDLEAGVESFEGETGRLHLVHPELWDPRHPTWIRYFDATKRDRPAVLVGRVSESRGRMSSARTIGILVEIGTGNSGVVQSGACQHFQSDPVFPW